MFTVKQSPNIQSKYSQHSSHQGPCWVTWPLQLPRWALWAGCSLQTCQSCVRKTEEPHHTFGISPEKMYYKYPQFFSFWKWTLDRSCNSMQYLLIQCMYKKKKTYLYFGTCSAVKKKGIIWIGKYGMNTQNAESETKWGLHLSGSLQGEWTRFFLAKMTTLLTSWWGLLGSRRKSGHLIQDQMTSETNDKTPFGDHPMTSPNHKLGGVITYFQGSPNQLLSIPV